MLINILINIPYFNRANHHGAIKDHVCDTSGKAFDTGMTFPNTRDRCMNPET